jgi:hypothetical protein
LPLRDLRPRERCGPHGVPNSDVIALVEPYFIYQTPDKVVMISQGGLEIRHIYLNVSYSKNVEPSWYGESIGHYEGGNTLVVDTIGISAVVCQRWVTKWQAIFGYHIANGPGEWQAPAGQCAGTH